jgi:hypothetical protein
VVWSSVRAVVLTLLVASVAHAEERRTFVVSAAPPLDAERLAEVLRVYLDSYDIDVRTAPALPTTELREQLDRTRALGDDVRALASVRIADAIAGTVEVLFVDHLAGKSIVAAVQRAPRDEDFYRSLALKIQALLRSALYEKADELVTTAPALARLVGGSSTPTLVRAAAPLRHRLSLEVAYALDTFPAGNVVQHGVGVLGRVELGRLYEVALGIDALVPLQAVRGDVSTQFSTVPLRVSAAVHLRRPRLEGAIGAVGELLIVLLDASSPATPVRSDRSVAPALGVELAGRVRLSAPAWLYVRTSCLGVLAGERYLVRGDVVFDWTRLQVSAEVGLGLAVW